MKMPFMFRRDVAKVNDDGTKAIYGMKAIYVVKLALCYDFKSYNPGWMDDEVLGDGADDSVMVPDVDLCEERWVFDSDDSLLNELDAVNKMKELWSALDIPKF